jgi:HD superfamily phosphodiesterase
MGHRSRTEIFLSSLGVPERTVRRLFKSLARFETEPASPEEEIVHDAVRLEAMGAYGVARGLADAYRERLDIPEMADAIDAAADAPLRTDQGRELAGPRRALMREFARRLREEHAEFGRR